jgi:fatty-acyl-CoA synthase
MFDLRTKAPTIQAALAELAKIQPNSPAITFIQRDVHKTITVADLHREAEIAAKYLGARSIEPGDLVILVLKHSLELIYSFWGAALLGAIPSIFPFLTEKLDAGLYRERVKLLVEHSGAKAVITYPEFFPELKALLAESGCGVLSSSHLLQPADGKIADVGREELGIALDAIALLQHSSGSTGLQKGVALSHRAVLRHIEAYGTALALDPQKDVIVSWLPLYHDMGLIAGFVMPIVTNTPLVMMSPFEWVRQPGMLLDAISRYKGTLCWLPNFAYNHIARTIRPTDGLDLSSLRAVINCSEPVYHQSHQMFLEKLEPFGLSPDSLAVSYAMAENTFAVTQTPMGAPSKLDVVEIAALQERKEAVASESGQTVVSCGFPIESVELKVLDDILQPLPERRVGEIALKSNFMLSGYHKRPDLDEKAITKDGWYLTGDMGYLANGELFVTGRKKDLIIVGGKNIFPQDIEAIANRTPGIHPGRSVAFGVFDERLGSEKIVIVAETEDGANLNDVEKELRAGVVQETEVTLGDLRLVPRGWVIKTSSGKHARSDNREKYLREFAPRN